MRIVNKCCLWLTWAVVVVGYMLIASDHIIWQHVKVGEHYYWTGDKSGDPFKHEINRHEYVVLDVKNGWVRYQNFSGGPLNDEREKCFLRMYQKQT